MNCSKLTHTCVFVLGNYNTHIFICIYFFSLIFHIHSDILVSAYKNVYDNSAELLPLVFTDWIDHDPKSTKLRR